MARASKPSGKNPIAAKKAAGKRAAGKKASAKRPAAVEGHRATSVDSVIRAVKTILTIGDEKAFIALCNDLGDGGRLLVPTAVHNAFVRHVNGPGAKAARTTTTERAEHVVAARAFAARVDTECDDTHNC